MVYVYMYSYVHDITDKLYVIAYYNYVFFKHISQKHNVRMNITAL